MVFQNAMMVAVLFVTPIRTRHGIEIMDCEERRSEEEKFVRERVMRRACSAVAFC